MSDPVMTPKEAAEICRCHPRTLKRWIKAKGYNFRRVSMGRYKELIPAWMVERFVAERSPQPSRHLG